MTCGITPFTQWIFGLHIGPSHFVGQCHNDGPNKGTSAAFSSLRLQIMPVKK